MQARLTDTRTRLQDFRSFYAHLISSRAGVPEIKERLAAAFDSTPRERFVERGPWRVLTPAGYICTPSDDPAFLYQDIVVALLAEGPINNGEPSLHATCLAHIDPQEGETVIHIGAGTGHYEASVASVTLDTVASVAQTMASQGYVLTAFGAGGNPTFGWLLVGTRLQGSTAPRPIFVSTYYRPSDDLYYSKGYVDVVTIYDNPTPSPSTTTRIWIVEQ